MQGAETVLDVIRVRHRARADVITGEQGAGKLARPDREGADGKGPPHGGTSPAAYFTLEAGGGRRRPSPSYRPGAVARSAAPRAFLLP